jgi:phage recombination protein Bet
MTEGAELVLASSLTEEQVRLVKDTIIPGATDDELALFVNQCDRTHLDPFAKQIYCIKRWNGTAKKETYQTQVSIDGARLVAQRSGEYAGQTPTYWCGPDGVWVDVWLKPEHPVAAKVGTYRVGFVEAMWAVALWDGYAVKKRDGSLMEMWKKMGPLMLGKCAEMLSLRKAFPMELSGLYSTEEMEQAGGTEVAVAATAEGGGGGVQPGAAVPVTTPAPPAAAKPATRRRSAPPKAGTAASAAAPVVTPTTDGTVVVDGRTVPPTESETLKNAGVMTPQGPTTYPGFESDTPEERAAWVEADAVAVVKEAFPGAEEFDPVAEQGTGQVAVEDAVVWDDKRTCWVNSATGEVVGAGEPPKTAAAPSKAQTGDRLPLKQCNVVRRLLAQAGKPEDVKHLRSIVGRPDLKDVGDLSQDEFEVVVTALQPAPKD